jgi:C-terminal processing protease CtpA/Prc
MQSRFFAAVWVLLFSLATAAWAGERGYFGFNPEIDAEGMFWNPTLRAVTIAKVSPKSPAEAAGMKQGDAVLEVAGKVVAGAKGKEIQALMEKEIGESVRMKLKHANGEVYEITMAAVAKTW